MKEEDNRQAELYQWDREQAWGERPDAKQASLSITSWLPLLSLILTLLDVSISLRGGKQDTTPGIAQWDKAYYWIKLNVISILLRSYYIYKSTISNGPKGDTL